MPHIGWRDQEFLWWRTVRSDPLEGGAGFSLVVDGLPGGRAVVRAHARGTLIRLGGPGRGRALLVAFEDECYGRHNTPASI